MDKKELTQLVINAQQDKEQFELFYQEVVNKIYFWCLVTIKHESDAQDICQEVMIKVYKNIGKLNHPEYFTTWIYQITHNCCNNYFNKKGRTEVNFIEMGETESNLANLIEEERRDSLPNKALDIKETKEIVLSILEELPYKQREVMILYYLEELNTSEISDILSVNPASIRRRLFRGRKTLEDKVSKYQEKYKVKLYGTSILAILGSLLSEYRDEVCSNSTLNYNKARFEQSLTSASSATVATAISTKVIIALVSVVVLVVAAIGGVYLNQNSNSNNTKSSTKEESAMSKKVKGSPYIKNINYLAFPTRTYVDVKIALQDKAENKSVRILFKNKEVSFTQNGLDVFVQAKENGIYTIAVDKDEVAFEIKQIDKHALELIGVSNNDDHIKLLINDEENQIDLKRTYILYSGNKYTINEDLMVEGVFKGEATVILYNKQGQFREYLVDIK